MAGPTWVASLATGADCHLEHRVRRHDGVYRWFRVFARAARDVVAAAGA